MHQTHRKNEYEQVSGIFSSYSDFTGILESMLEQGFQEDDISVLMSESTHQHYFTPEEHSKAPECAAVGTLSGGIIGMIIGSLTLIGNVLLPGVGLLVAGPLVGALTAGAVGAAAGGLIGALVGSGLPEHEAKFFEDALKEKGQVLVVAHVPRERTKEVKALFERFHVNRLKVHTCNLST